MLLSHENGPLRILMHLVFLHGADLHLILSGNLLELLLLVLLELADLPSCLLQTV